MSEQIYDYAVLDDNNIVINKIVAESLEIAELVTNNKKCIKYNGEEKLVELGSIYDDSTDTFSLPE
jgi:hypothetical protein